MINSYLRTFKCLEKLLVEEKKYWLISCAYHFVLSCYLYFWYWYWWNNLKIHWWKSYRYSDKATKKKSFTCGWTSQVGSVGTLKKKKSFYFWWQKLPKEHGIFEKKIWLFWQNFLGKMFWFILNIFQTKFYNFGQKTSDFTRFWQIKKSPKMKKKPGSVGS